MVGFLVVLTWLSIARVELAQEPVCSDQDPSGKRSCSSSKKSSKGKGIAEGKVGKSKQSSKNPASRRVKTEAPHWEYQVKSSRSTWVREWLEESLLKLQGNARLHPFPDGVRVSDAWEFSGSYSSAAFVLDGVTTTKEHKAILKLFHEDRGLQWVSEPILPNAGFDGDTGRAVEHDMDSEAKSGPLLVLAERIHHFLSVSFTDREVLLARAYTNWQNKTSSDTPHPDECLSKEQRSWARALTVIYYTQSDPGSYAGGHTLIFNGRCLIHAKEEERPAMLKGLLHSTELEVELAIRPRARRVLLFDSDLLHSGTSPSALASSKPRLTTVFKFSVNREASE